LANHVLVSSSNISIFLLLACCGKLEDYVIKSNTRFAFICWRTVGPFLKWKS